MQNQNGEMSQQNVVANGQIQCTVMAPTMDGTQGFISPMVDQIQYMQQQAFNPAIMQQQQQQQQQVLNPMMQQEQVLNLDMQQQQHSVLGTNDGASQNFYMYSENVSQPVIDLTQQQVQEGQNSLNTEQSSNFFCINKKNSIVVVRTKLLTRRKKLINKILIFDVEC